MANAYFVPDDFDEATLAASPAVETTMPVTNMQLDARDRVTRSTGIATQVFTGHWNTNNRYIDSFIMARHTGYGGSIRLQLFSASDSATGQVYDSGTVVIISALVVSESFAWGIAKLGLPINDQLADEAAYSLFFTGVQCASFKITLSNCQALYWQIGRIVMGRRVEAPWNPQHGMTFGERRGTQHTRMPIGGSIRSRAGARWNELTADMVQATDAERAAWRDLIGQIANRTVGVSIRPGAGGREERDHVDIMALEDASPNAWANVAFHQSNIRMIGI